MRIYVNVIGAKCFENTQCVSNHCDTDPSRTMQCCAGTCAMTQAAKPITTDDTTKQYLGTIDLVFFTVEDDGQVIVSPVVP